MNSFFFFNIKTRTNINFQIAWSKKDVAERERLAPNICKYAKWFNKISMWAATEIIQLKDAGERAVIISKFIIVADELLKHRNFNGVMEMLSALHGSSISRLKQSWALIPENFTKKFDEITELMAPAKNFEKYRTKIKVKTKELRFSEKII